MKKIFLIFGLFLGAFFFGQKSGNFYQISYNSICCGPPSDKPVNKYITDFQAKNKCKTIEVFQQTGLGREGEFRLFLGIDTLSKSKRKKFISGLEAIINQQNAAKKGDEGTIYFQTSELITKEKLLAIPNLSSGLRKDTVD